MTDGWRLQGLTVGFGRRGVVAGIEAAIPARSLVAITGANGSGKSCLLRTIADELRPLAGAVVAPADFDRRDLGLVPQAVAIDERLPLALGELAALGTAGYREPFLRERLAAALATVGLGDRARQLWRESSGGERQRALIARALVRRPRLLLLDEATSNLDQTTADLLFAALRAESASRDLTVIAVVHDADLVARHADAVLHLADGRAALRAGAPA